MVGKRIGLIDVDGHNFPNIPLMKLSAWHKKQGDSVEWYEQMKHGMVQCLELQAAAVRICRKGGRAADV